MCTQHCRQLLLYILHSDKILLTPSDYQLDGDG